jgi:hypothetical protein
MHERFGSYFPHIELRYFGRDESASSETGSFKQYQAEQKKLVEDAFNAVPFQGLRKNDTLKGEVRNEDGG